MNPLYNLFNNNQNPGTNTQNSFAEFVQNFRKTSQMTPQQKVQEMLNSGQMSQQQFNQLRAMANRITGMNK